MKGARPRSNTSSLPPSAECETHITGIISVLCIYLPVTSCRCWHTPNDTKPENPCDRNPFWVQHKPDRTRGLAGHPQANGFVAAGVETCWSRLDHSGGELHDVFIVISEGSDGAHIARTVYAASEDDARQTHQENYPGEPIVAVHQ